MAVGAIVNVISFQHPHVRSLYEEGLWGFPENRVTRPRWESLEVGCKLLFYGSRSMGDAEVRGIFLAATLERKTYSTEPVSYWVYGPTRYPLQIVVKFDRDWSIERSKPILKEELAKAFGIPLFGQKFDRWSLVVFGDVKRKGVTYPFDRFARVSAEFETRNRLIPVSKGPDHDQIKEVIYNMGLLQQRISLKEVELDGYKLDVAWKRTPRSDPYIVFEIHISGNMYEALTKLKHARDIWNSKPVLITTPEQVERAKEIISGAFHEIKGEVSVIDWERVAKAFELKGSYRRLESELGIY